MLILNQSVGDKMASVKNNGFSKGKVVYNESIIQGIVAIAVSGVEGVVLKLDKKGKSSLKDNIKVVSEKDGVFVSVTVSVSHGYSIPDIAYNIQHGVRQNVENMSKYKVSKIDVYIDDVLFEEKQ